MVFLCCNGTYKNSSFFGNLNQMQINTKNCNLKIISGISPEDEKEMVEDKSTRWLYYCFCDKDSRPNIDNSYYWKKTG